MKKFVSILIAIMMLSSISVFGQNFANKGVWELGGMIGFSSTTIVFDGESANDALNTFRFEPYVGYFVINSLELGLIPSYQTSSFGDASESTLGIYFAPAWNFDLKSQWFPFIEGRIGYASISYDSGEPDSDEITNSGFAWGARGGAKYQIGNSAIASLSLGYTQNTLNPDNWEGDRNGTNIFDVMFGFTVFLGK